MFALETKPVKQGIIWQQGEPVTDSHFSGGITEGVIPPLDKL